MKEDAILDHLSNLSARIAESDAVLRKLSALPEALAIQANNIEQLATRVTEISEGYDENLDVDNVDLEEVADQAGDSLNPPTINPPSFTSLLNPPCGEVKGKNLCFYFPDDFRTEVQMQYRILNL